MSKVGNKEDPPKTSIFTREDQQEETTSINTEENVPYGNSHIPKVLEKALKTSAENMEYRYISREEKQSKTY